MSRVTEILVRIDSIQRPESGFNLINIDGKYWGKTNKGEIVFAIESVRKTVIPMTQNTKFLKLFINTTFIVSDENGSVEKNLSALILNDNDTKHTEIFVRLSLSLSDDLDEDKLLKYFLELKDLFSNTKKITQLELQGMFGELYVMYVFKINYGVNISPFYQKEDRRKFDFSISDKKKVEIKTTTKPERVHHFLQQQLDTDRYDIKVVSLMLQRDDAGMSLNDLISECKDLFADNLGLIIHIESMIKNCSSDDLSNIRFNYDYAKDNLRIFDAMNIPRLKEKNEEGVFNVEYDSDLTNSLSMSPSKLIDWIK